jgi:hypothetical protein
MLYSSLPAAYRALRQSVSPSAARALLSRQAKHFANGQVYLPKGV